MSPDIWRIANIDPATRFNDYTSLVRYEELYRDHSTNSVKTRSQQMEIEKLKNQLEEKKIDKKKELDNLIAYYYSR